MNKAAKFSGRAAGAMAGTIELGSVLAMFLLVKWQACSSLSRWQLNCADDRSVADVPSPPVSLVQPT